MTSQDHINFRMLSFHANLARFMVSAGNFMTALFLAYDVVCSYEHDREHVAAFLNPYSRMGDCIYHLSQYVFVAGFRFDNVDHFIKFIGIVANMDWIATPPLHCGPVLPLRHPTLQNSPIATDNTSTLVVYITTDDVAPSFVVLCALLAAKFSNYRTTFGRSS
jgi:hypothetical protein